MQHEILDSEKALSLAISQSKTPEKLIIVGKPDDIEMLEESMEYNDKDPATIIEESNNVDAVEWFAARKSEMEEDYEMDFSEIEGVWPNETAPESRLVLLTDFSTGETIKRVTCISVNVDQSWKVPAELKYGGWNECPNPEIHCAVWRYWEEKYGARIIAVSSDIIEAYVENPPTDKVSATLLAQQQYIYCSDIVEQGTETIANLAATLMNGKYWFFWWD